MSVYFTTMDKVIRDKEEAYISYLDERDNLKEAWIEVIKFDASFIKFRTNSGNIITLPTSRILRIKQRGYKDERI